MYFVCPYDGGVPADAGSDFLPPRVISIGDSPSALEVVDLDGDGRLDAVVATTTGVAILSGQVDGGFGDPMEVPMSPAPTAFAVGDLDRDGRLDLATVSFYSNDLHVYLADGDAGFAGPVVYPLQANEVNPSAIVLSDLNGDGFLEYLIAPYNGLRILGLRTDGGVGVTQAYFDNSESLDLDTGDLNGDGRTDVVLADNGGAEISVHLGLPDGGLTEDLMPWLQDPPQYVESVRLVDLNHDGFPDLVGASRGTSYSFGGLYYRLGRGDGTFLPYSVDHGCAGFEEAVRASDVDSDGNPDVVAIEGSSSSVLVFRGDGLGHLRPREALFVGGSASGLQAADLNGDGKPDLLVTVPARNALLVLLHK